MSNLALWKYSEETQEILKEIREEITIVKENLTLGTALSLPTNEMVVREYSLSIGRIEGLMFLESLLTREESNYTREDETSY